ncbi:MAG: leucine-rich repeat domain-containing protein, partial [Clostridia bacterium]|nr:leucine-rich repeat domain-containing protein [Clostridia bacterium]
MNRLKKVILGLSIAFTMAIALVIGLVNMPKPTKLNNTPLNTLETNIEDKVYQVIDDGNTLNYEYDSTMQSAEDSTKVYSYHFKNIMNENMAVYMHELECEGLTFEYAVSNTEQTDTTSLTFSSTLSVEPLAPKGTTGSEVYVYVRVTPTSESVTYNCPIKWTFGHRQTITCYSDGEQVGEPVIGICNAATINEYNLPTITVADGYVLKWFSDPEQKKLTTFPLETSNEALQLYAIKAFVLSDSSWFQLNEDGQSYSVVKGNGKLTGAIIIPETYNNLPVIAIKSGTDYSSGVFFSQTSLTSIIIPASVISIGNYAFWGCFELMGVIIPNSLTNIGNEAFCACEKLISIDLSICINLTSIGENAFAFCDSLSRITIPKGVTSIGDCAFYECTGLTSVTFANNSKLTSIQWGTFSLCLALSSITIPSSVTSIEAHAFGYCDSLRSIIFEQEGIWYYGTEEQQEAM